MTDAPPKNPSPPDRQTVLAQLAAFARVVAPTLENKSYYELLNVTASSPAAAVRAAYYRVAAQLHPDRYHGLDDATAKQQLQTIYARISEAYRVLSDADKRASYDRALAEGKKRLVVGDRERKGPRNPEDGITHAEARKFFRMAMLAFDRRDWKSAVLNLNFARGFEPGAAVINERLAEAQAQLKAAAKPTG